MAEMSEQIEIPDRPLFKASEVCDLLKVQPYVLRTWEAEFRDLGVAKGNARIYRREDVERAQRIKHLLLVEGLTLAGVRRKLEEEQAPPLTLDDLEPAPTGPTLDAAARDRIAAVKQGLRSLLDLLDAPRHPEARGADAADDFSLASPAVKATGGRGAKKAGEAVAHDAHTPASPRRKRSA